MQTTLHTRGETIVQNYHRSSEATHVDHSQGLVQTRSESHADDAPAYGNAVSCKSTNPSSCIPHARPKPRLHHPDAQPDIMTTTGTLASLLPRPRLSDDKVRLTPFEALAMPLTVTSKAATEGPTAYQCRSRWLLRKGRDSRHTFCERILVSQHCL